MKTLPNMPPCKVGQIASGYWIPRGEIITRIYPPSSTGGYNMWMIQIESGGCYYIGNQVWVFTDPLTISEE